MTSLKGTPLRTRSARIDDADAMGQVLLEVIANTGRQRPADTAFVLSNYILNPDDIRCTIALTEGHDVLGFQSLVKAVRGNRYGVPEGWGIIGTHIAPRAHRRGVGTALFRSSREAAELAGILRIDACIGADNVSALRYYDALGFKTYREGDRVVQKVYIASSASSADQPCDDAA